jgi:hypothetical protein
MQLNFKFLGWNTSDGADKIWGVIYLEPDRIKNTIPNHSYTQVVTFWGRRGSQLQTKLTLDDVNLNKLIDKKIKNGYSAVDLNNLDAVYPGFYSDLEKLVIWNLLKI